MKPKTLMLLAVACGCGLVAMLGVQQAMQVQAPVKAHTVKVFVALENIETGMKLTEDNTSFKEMPVNSIPEDAALHLEDIQERAAKVPLMSGDVVRKSKLTDKGEWGKSVGIPAGMRVIGIPVDDSHTISGLIRPGDRVDVLVTYQGRGERGAPVSKTKTLLEYVAVFGMDDQTASKMDQKDKGVHAKIASLIVTPEQAGYVILAQRKGTLALSWRRRSDDELAQTKAVDEKLMEELEGTVGMFESGEDRNYERGAGFAAENGTAQAATPETTQHFLDETSASPQATARPKPAGAVWTLEIYSGNESVSQQFEIPLDEVALKNAIEPEKMQESFRETADSLNLN